VVRTRRHLALAAACGIAAAVPGAAQGDDIAVDAGLVLAVDVSGSISSERYRLQMEGIAATFEDPGVQNAILAGPHHALVITLVEWSEKAVVSVPWTRVASSADAAAFAALVRQTPRIGAEFTCMSVMFRFVADKVLPRMPAHAERTVVDVSGDGSDNCNPNVPVDAVRDELVADATTINGLPILEGEEATMLEGWYASHVVGGTNGFLVAARGFDDFARAMRRKFLIEISALPRKGDRT
jgi:hypothetical protein